MQVCLRRNHTENLETLLKKGELMKATASLGKGRRNTPMDKFSLNQNHTSNVLGQNSHRSAHGKADARTNQDTCHKEEEPDLPIKPKHIKTPCSSKRIQGRRGNRSKSYDECFSQSDLGKIKHLMMASAIRGTWEGGFPHLTSR